MHNTRRKSPPNAGMSVVPDIFTKADAGVVVGIHGAEVFVSAMPTAMALVGDGAENVVGHVHVAGQVAGDLVNRASKDAASISEKDEFGRHLQQTVERAVGGLEEMEAVSLVVDGAESAAEADAQLGRMLASLKEKAVASGKTVVVHLVVEEQTRRRLQEENEQNYNNNADSGYSYGQKTMYEIQTFNVITWTAVGLVVLLFMVMSAFIGMPLMPDTLLFGEAGKMAGSD